jgi:hypothetical protein
LCHQQILAIYSRIPFQGLETKTEQKFWNNYQF